MNCGEGLLDEMGQIHKQSIFLVPYQLVMQGDFLFIPCLSVCLSIATKTKFIQFQRDYNLTLLLLNTTCPILANSVDPDNFLSFLISYYIFYMLSLHWTE